jgi:hypothetical protein
LTHDNEEKEDEEEEKKSSIIKSFNRISESDMIELLNRFLSLEMTVLLRGKRASRHCHTGLQNIFYHERRQSESKEAEGEEGLEDEQRRKEEKVKFEEENGHLEKEVLNVIKLCEWQRVSLKSVNRLFETGEICTNIHT